MFVVFGTFRGMSLTLEDFKIFNFKVLSKPCTIRSINSLFIHARAKAETSKTFRLTTKFGQFEGLGINYGIS